MRIIVLLLFCLAATGCARRLNRSYRRHRNRERDIVFHNQERNVINDETRTDRPFEHQKQKLLDDLGYTQTLDYSSGDVNSLASKESLSKQKFLLQLLQNVQELQEESLQKLGQNLIIDEAQYIGQLDDDMLQLLQLCINGQMLGKQDTYNALNLSHRQQMFGLYKLLVRARDWSTFQRNALFARQHLNGILFINSLLLAIKDRADTQDLIVPDINEILPELFYDQELQERLGKNIKVDDLLVNSQRSPKIQLNDIMGQRGGTFGGSYMQRGLAQPKKTWQEWRQEKMERQSKLELQTKEDDIQKLVLPVSLGGDEQSNDLNERIAYLTEDVGLNNLWYSFGIDSLRLMGQTAKSATDEGIQALRSQNIEIENRLDDQLFEEKVEKLANLDKAHIEAKKNYKQLFETVQKLYQKVQKKQEKQENSQNLEDLNQRLQDKQESDILKEYLAGTTEISKSQSQSIPKSGFLRNGIVSETVEHILKLQKTLANKLEQKQMQTIKNELLKENVNEMEDNARLLKVGRRRQNQLALGIGEKDMDAQAIESILNKKQRSEELGVQKNKSNIGIQNVLKLMKTDVERLLEINRRRMNKLQNAHEIPENYRQITDELQTNLDTSEESRENNARESILQSGNQEKQESNEKSEELAEKNSSEESGTLNIESIKNILQTVAKKLGKDKSSAAIREDITKELNDERLLKVSRRRLPRNASNRRDELKSREADLELRDQRAGELILTTMQQMLARIRMEELSHILADKEQLANSRKFPKPIINTAQQYRERLNQRMLETRGNRQMLLQIQNIEQIFQKLVDKQLQSLVDKKESLLDKTNIQQLIGDIFLGRFGETGQKVQELWSQFEMQLRGIKLEPMESPILLSNFAQQLRHPIFRFMMERLLNIANRFNDYLPDYNKDELLYSDVEINDVKLDKLQTFFESVDADLINLLPQKSLDLGDLKKIPVARQQRLNHEPFALKYDIKSGKEQRVVIRTFLGPKLDENGYLIDLEQNRRNFILLDAFATQLIQGRNVIKRRSLEFSTISSHNTTSFTALYQQIMQGIDGSKMLELQRLGGGGGGNNCRLPQRLLLPRGLEQGLLMQIFVIVSPVTLQDLDLQQRLRNTEVCGLGTATLALDTRPLGFPLDRPIDEQQFMNLSNVLLKDIAIYHDETRNNID